MGTVSKLHKLYVGLNDKVTKKQIFPRDIAIEAILSALQYKGIDCTISMGKGIYTHEDTREVVKEETIIIEILDFGHIDFESIKATCEVIKQVLNQESIGYQVVTLDKCELL